MDIFNLKKLSSVNVKKTVLGINLKHICNCR